MENQNRAAELAGFFLNEKEAEVEAVIAKTSGFWGKVKFISVKEIVELSKSALIIRDEESLVEPNEMIRLSKKMKKRAKIIGEKVVTKNGDFIGTVNDFVIESGSLTITRLYVKKLFDQRIIHSSAIIKIEQKIITIKDKFEMAKPEVAPMNAKAEPA
jgi:sporulation protein YlmC with PRC-barrel domain